MKTIFITSFHPMISRNILCAGVLDELKKYKDIRVIVLVPDYKRKYFEELSAMENIVVEGIPLYRASKRKRGLFFKKASMFLVNTESARTRRHLDYYHKRKITIFILWSFFSFVGRSLLIRRAMRFLDASFAPKGFFAALIEQYSPDVIFSTDAQNENDVSLMQDARARGIQIVGMVRSWDNLTLRLLRIFPDVLFVGSDEVKKDAVIYQNYPEKRIRVVGQPHYSRYLQKPSRTKSAFAKLFGLMPNRKIILYAPVSDALIKENDIDKYVIELLGTLDVAVLVRFPPEKQVSLRGLHKPDNVIFHYPGKVFRPGKIGDREIRPEDDESLIQSLYSSDLIITGPTSICLDAALLDKPVIAVDFYKSERPFYERVWTYRDNHITRLLSTGGVHHSKSPEDFLEAVHAYLKNPQLDKEGRARIRKIWFSHTDGRSSKRLVDELVNSLYVCKQF